MEVNPGYQRMGIRKDVQRRWCWSWVFKEVFGKRLRLPVRKECFPCTGGMRGGEDGYAVVPLLWWLRVWRVRGGLAKINCRRRDWTGLCEQWGVLGGLREEARNEQMCVFRSIFALIKRGDIQECVIPGTRKQELWSRLHCPIWSL